MKILLVAVGSGLGGVSVIAGLAAVFAGHVISQTV